MCAFDCRVWLERFITWVWKPLGSIYLIHPFIAAPEKHGFASKNWGLGFQKANWSCGFYSMHLTYLVVDRRGSFSDIPLTPMSPSLLTMC